MDPTKIESDKPQQSKRTLTPLEKRLLASLRRLRNWVNDGQPSNVRDEIVAEAGKLIAEAEAIDLS